MLDLDIFVCYAFIKLGRGVTMINVLLVDDDKELVELMSRFLNNNGINAFGVTNAIEALNCLNKDSYDIIVTDIMMPQIDGFAFVEKVRKVNEDIPVIFLSAKDDIVSKQMGYSLGIDDYIVKPIDLNELILKLKAMYRRIGIKKDRYIKVGNFQMDATTMTAQINSREIQLTTREFKILNTLLLYPQQVFSRSRLLDDFWSDDSDTSLRAVDVYITRLRDKLVECDGFKIVTVRGIGYKVVLI